MKVLHSENEIKLNVQRLGKEITEFYKGKVTSESPLVCLCILKGSFIFFSDLIREINHPVTCEFFGVSSYGNETTSSGEVRVTLDLNSPIRDQHVLIVEDIIDTGLTMKFMQETLNARQPASLATCALLYKPDALKTDTSVDFIGFEIGNEFVVGYGVDYAQNFRNLPYLGILEEVDKGELSE